MIEIMITAVVFVVLFIIVGLIFGETVPWWMLLTAWLWLPILALAISKI